MPFALNDLLVGAYRYGGFNKKRLKEQRLIKALEHRVKLYKKTGNAEHLIDIGNYAMLEFVAEGHPQFHFEPIGDHDFHCEEKK